MTESAFEERAVLPVALTNKNALYQAYMPFIKHGALFIPTKQKFQLGEEVFLLLELMEEAEKFSIAAKVVWITPLGAQGGCVAGIGVQFTSDNANEVRKKIETYLAGALDSEQPTDTF